ncbi:unnamed protein product [Mesocestoides corti]|uniref:Transmembrane protein n=1 Tax=Mesocestoides corti TaxID=53468 RepID=A0A0R3UK89_MESCO|nr:unnamed protein product [Mesocestoides corti]
MIRDTTHDYRFAFMFLGFAQMLGAVIALQAILYRKHNCFRHHCDEADSEVRRSREALLSKSRHLPASYVGILNDKDVEEIEVENEALEEEDLLPQAQLRSFPSWVRDAIDKVEVSTHVPTLPLRYKGVRNTVTPF